MVSDELKERLDSVEQRLIDDGFIPEESDSNRVSQGGTTLWVSDGLRSRLREIEREEGLGSVDEVLNELADIYEEERIVELDGDTYHLVPEGQ